MADNNNPQGKSLLDIYAPEEFSSYEDFIKRFKINVPGNFNFGFDVVDEMAKRAPE